MFQKIIITAALFLIHSNLYANKAIEAPTVKITKNKNHIQYLMERGNPTNIIHQSKKNTPFNNDIGTPIFDFTGTVNDKNVTCEDLHQTRDDLFSGLMRSHFFLSLILDCDTEENGLSYHFLAMIDPQDEEANEVGRDIVTKLEGMDFYGSTIHSEPAKAVIYFITLSIGKWQEDAMLQYDFKIASYTFKSIHDGISMIDNEIWLNLEPTDENIIIPMIDKIFGGGDFAKEALHKSNTVGLQYFPTILYGDDLKEYSTMVGTGWGSRGCNNQDRETCL